MSPSSRRKQEQEAARRYAKDILRSDAILTGLGQHVNWPLLNAEIIGIFGEAGLLRIKTRAWKIIESGEVTRESE